MLNGIKKMGIVKERFDAELGDLFGLRSPEALKEGRPLHGTRRVLRFGRPPGMLHLSAFSVRMAVAARRPFFAGSAAPAGRDVSG
jgi:hypothetical protein